MDCGMGLEKHTELSPSVSVDGVTENGDVMIVSERCLRLRQEPDVQLILPLLKGLFIAFGHSSGDCD